LVPGVPLSLKNSGSMFDRFLVPLDGSELAEKAANTAAELARRCKAQLIFLKVCTSQDEVSQAVDYLDRISRAARMEGLTARGDVCVGDAADKIVAIAEEERADLIVMSSHGRTGLARTVFGSVAETVMRKSSCPVMVVKAHRPATGDGQLQTAIA
jgi:nucleotide-binding universal stress UspA family protein